MARKKPKTNKQIVADANELARLFYQAHGYDVPKGFDFAGSQHPQETGTFNLVMIAYEFIEGTDVQSVVDELEDE